MARSRSSAAALALAALSAACVTRDVETHPFHVRATVEATGASLADSATGRALVNLFGPGELRDETTLVVTDELIGAVTISFDRRALPELRIPDRVHGQTVLVQVVVDPAGEGPRREPLPVQGFRIATGLPVPSFEFSLYEASYAGGDGLPEAPALFQPLYVNEDVPYASVGSDFLHYEPARCGLVFEDFFEVIGDLVDVVLQPGERATGITVGSRPDPWTVVHVAAWHRDGRCSHQTGTWTQIVAWR